MTAVFSGKGGGGGVYNIFKLKKMFIAAQNYLAQSIKQKPKRSIDQRYTVRIKFPDVLQ